MKCNNCVAHIITNDFPYVGCHKKNNCSLFWDKAHYPCVNCHVSTCPYRPDDILPCVFEEYRDLFIGL
jgi:hypothetical protein